MDYSQIADLFLGAANGVDKTLMGGYTGSQYTAAKVTSGALKGVAKVFADLAKTEVDESKPKE